MADAMLAPSAHNTQPVRWSLNRDVIEVFADLTRRLPVGDPEDRDLKIACGAAVEGTVLALAARGLGAEVIWRDPSDQIPFRHVASIESSGKPVARDVELAKHVQLRVTHRGGFGPVPAGAMAVWKSPHLTLVTKPADIKWFAAGVDQASANLMQDKALRQELLEWMRLAPSDAGYHRDGLNKDTLFLEGMTARMVGPILGSRLYDMLSGLGLGPTLSGEKARTTSASVIALFHWPRNGSMFEAGRVFYRTWLEAAGRGLAGWPAAALADDPKSATVISERFAIPQDHELLNALRLGQAKGATPKRTRLPVSELII